MDKPESFYKFTGCFHQGTWEYYKDKGEDALIAGAAESLEKRERDELERENRK